MSPILLSCILLPFALSIRVLSTGLDVAKHKEGSGAELVHPSLADQDTVTICSRFKTYQFTHHGYKIPSHVLLMLNDKPLLASAATTMKNPFNKPYAGNNWRNGNVYLWDFFGTNRMVDWRPDVWNDACIALSDSESRRFHEIKFNGLTVRTNNQYTGYHKEQASKIKLMMAWHQGIEYFFTTTNDKAACKWSYYFFRDKVSLKGFCSLEH